MDCVLSNFNILIFLKGGKNSNNSSIQTKFLTHKCVFYDFIEFFIKRFYFQPHSLIFYIFYAITAEPFTKNCKIDKNPF